MTDLSEKTLFISGASRGIGLAIAKRAAQDGANIVGRVVAARVSIELLGCGGNKQIGRASCRERVCSFV